MTPEGRVKARVKRALELAWDASYRFMPVQNGMGRMTLDMLYCIEGLFMAIETKVPGKKLTDRQRQTAEEIARAGGLVFVVRDDDDIARMLRVIRFWVDQCQHQHTATAGVIYDTMEHWHS